MTLQMIIRKLEPQTQFEFDKIPSFKSLQRLVVYLNGCIRVLKFDQIEYIKADSNYSQIYLISGKKLLVTKTLKSLLVKLDNTFIRTHKSFVVNLRSIDSYDIKNSELTMVSGDCVCVSRNVKSFLKKLLN